VGGASYFEREYATSGVLEACNRIDEEGCVGEKLKIASVIWHASVFISATALAQFCGTAGWDSRRAAEYWDSVIPPKIRYPKEHDQVANFVRFTDPELQISVQDATRVCPRHN
jgi:hypothetical protein